jgi:hypothetical protein
MYPEFDGHRCMISGKRVSALPKTIKTQRSS